MKKVIVGLSGGVDSAVAVIMLQRAGYDVEGVFMRNWDSTLNNDILGNPNNPFNICPQEIDYLDAMEVAKKLQIKLHRIDFVEEYWDYVFKYFIHEYEEGRTPNPDILCNKEIKFKAFLEKAKEMGSDYIAMGHYARTKEIDGKIRLLKGYDKNKDQSYFLCQLSQEQINKSLFPLGEMTKAEVRKIAEEYKLNVATKKDSTGVCFIGERKFKLFLQNYIPAKPGKMLDLDGNEIGTHDGIMYYTIGQRHGLGIGGPGEPWFVIGKDIKNNILYVGQGKDNRYLYSNRCLVKDVNWLGDKLPKPLNCQVKFRYRQKDIEATIKKINDDQLEVYYPATSRAVTPGQAAVFYDGDILLGGAVIDKVYMDDKMRMY